MPLMIAKNVWISACALSFVPGALSRGRRSTSRRSVPLRSPPRERRCHIKPLIHVTPDEINLASRQISSEQVERAALAAHFAQSGELDDWIETLAREAGKREFPFRAVVASALSIGIEIGYELAQNVLGDAVNKALKE